MKVKEVVRSANISWSPASLQKCYLAAATLAQQLDDTFSTSSQLELFSMDAKLSGTLDLAVSGRVQLAQKMHRLIWTSFGSSDGAGTIIGSGEEGHIWMMDAAKILSGQGDPILHTSTSHSGAVRTLDFSPIQPNILASGASDSEIYIWDLNSPGKPMSPGGRIQPFEEVTSVSWNVKVAPILGSTFPSGQSVVWDLRKDGPILRVSQPGTRFRPRTLVWHPEVPTQMAVGSEEDTYPIIQLWDLRMAKTPLRAFERHQMGIMSLAWCRQDPDLLLSCGKDDQMFLWNPNSPQSDEGHLVHTQEWCFDAQWCPSHPGLLATSSFNSRVSVYSIMGGGPTEEEVQARQAELSLQKTDSSDPFAGLSQNQTFAHASYPPPRPPKWTHIACRGNFGFGGRLVSFVKNQQPVISLVTTDTNFLSRNVSLEGALRESRCLEFAQERVSKEKGQMDEMQWLFLEAAFQQNPRPRFLELLGYTNRDLRDKADHLIRPPLLSPGVDPKELSEKMQALLRQKSQSPTSRSSSTQEIRAPLPDFGEGASSLFTNAQTDFFSDQFEPTVPPPPQGSNQELANLLSEHTQTGDKPSVQEIPMGEITQQLQQFMIQAEDSSTEGLITRAVLLADYDTAVDLCLQQQKFSEALILATAGGKELYRLTLEKFFRRSRDPFSRFLSHVVWKQWGEIANSCTIASWREVLATLITYAPPEEFFHLCGQLGERLTREGGAPEYTQAALLCYICSGDLERLAHSLQLTEGDATDSVIRIVEKVVLLRLSIEQQSRPEQIRPDSLLEKVLLDYIQMLTSQGQLVSALLFLERLQLRSPASQLMEYRIRECLGAQQQHGPPFKIMSINPGRISQPRVQPVQPQIYKPAGRGSQKSEYQYSHTSQTHNIASQMSPQVPPIGSQIPPQVPPIGSQIPPQFPPMIPQMLPQVQPFVTPGSQENPLASKPFQSVAPTFSQIPSQPINPPPLSVQRFAPPPTDPIPGFNTSLPAWNDPPALGHKRSPHDFIQPITLPAPPVAAPVLSRQAPPVPKPAEPVRLPDLPQEVRPLLQVFEDLLLRCRHATSNPGQRQKLVDIGTKVDQLRELLRYGRLDTTIVGGLQQIAMCVQQRHYEACLPILNSLVASSSFSELGFLTGVKPLINIAKQLQV